MRSFLSLCALAVLSGLAACGGGGGGGGSAPTAPATVPSANVVTAGDGALVIHPAATAAAPSDELARRDHHFGETPGFVLETPVNFKETAGGTCEWTLARLSLMSGGVAIEEIEIGSDVITAAGYNRITANLDATYIMYFKLHTDNFGSVAITLEFTDHKDGRQFTATVPYGSFSGVETSPVPLGVPGGPVHRLGPSD